MNTSPERASPWRSSDFRIAWAAGLINNTGDWVLLVALPTFVFVETDSGLATAFLFVAQLTAGAVFGPIGGALVDSWDLKLSLIGTNLAQAITVLPLLAVTVDRTWPAYVVMAAQSALNQLNNPTNIALVPRLVESNELTVANAAQSAANSTARLVGAPLGGILVAWGGLAPVIVLDAVSFLLVALAGTFLRTDTRPIPPVDDEQKTIRDGLRLVQAHRPLAPLLAIQSVAQVAQGGFVVLFVVFVIETLGDDGSGLGAIRGVMAVGALVGSAVIARVASRVSSTSLFGIGLLGMGVVSLVFWNTPVVTSTLWVYVVLFALSGLPGAALTVGLFTTLQRASPDHALGRITGLMSAGDTIGATAGSIVAGLLVDRIDLRLLLNAQAAVYLTAGCAALVLLRPPPSDSQRVGGRVSA